ncbi:hypothetical protein O3M35_003634 [Rhynocoris fuscipes]|uniref:Uncharacterized protein n=1 Tax=Rhynocoris fuscipes TaxID=488301 RepID=A0AAW1CKP0_9HEMI
MKQLLAENGSLGAVPQQREPLNGGDALREASLIDGNFLSAIFGVIFLLIIGVSFYAFQNLYFAILKKFPSKHTEL